MDNTYQSRLDKIYEDGFAMLSDILSLHGDVSDYGATTVLKCLPEDLMFDLGNDRHLVEASSKFLFDDLGYMHTWERLTVGQFVKLMDYFQELYT